MFVEYNYKSSVFYHDYCHWKAHLCDKVAGNSMEMLLFRSSRCSLLRFGFEVLQDFDDLTMFFEVTEEDKET